MAFQTLALPADPADALEAIRRQSATTPVLVFKKSPTCGISHAAERQWRAFLSKSAGAVLAVAEIDVIAERPLARGLTALLEIDHQSPQALLFSRGAVVWHASHGDLTQSGFERALAQAGPPETSRHPDG